MSRSHITMQSLDDMGRRCLEYCQTAGLTNQEVTYSDQSTTTDLLLLVGTPSALSRHYRSNSPHAELSLGLVLDPSPASPTAHHFMDDADLDNVIAIRTADGPLPQYLEAVYLTIRTLVDSMTGDSLVGVDFADIRKAIWGRNPACVAEAQHVSIRGRNATANSFKKLQKAPGNVDVGPLRGCIHAQFCPPDTDLREFKIADKCLYRMLRREKECAVVSTLLHDKRFTEGQSDLIVIRSWEEQ